MTRHALVFGARGHIGRHVVGALGAAGVRVTAARRNEPLPPGDFTEIHHCAGAYRFGMTVEEARAGNVDTTRAVVELAARQPGLRRLVYVSGYRVSGLAEWDYRRLGAYEASKVEADAVFRARADELGVPWTIVNPASVIGPDSDQQLGLAANVKQLWDGSMKALPGNAFVPVVAAGHLAEFMALVPTDPSTERQAYWLLADDTPLLPDLLTLVGTHLGVRVPRLRVPLPLVRSLPAWITKADPETRSFLSTDRYPTASAREFAARHDLKVPDVRTLLCNWADNLVAGWIRSAS
ncbi:SDR family oxidoreductase [Actinophytocola sp. NPDC049390]|uniref:SDR family oxidoreductase n=1 Tax=Actinophytocola sp. NPDC049390 TaxID=3363894 RepID=UPI003794515D